MDFFSNVREVNYRTNFHHEDDIKWDPLYALEMLDHRCCTLRVILLWAATMSVEINRDFISLVSLSAKISMSVQYFQQLMPNAVVIFSKCDTKFKIEISLIIISTPDYDNWLLFQNIWRHYTAPNYDPEVEYFRWFQFGISKILEWLHRL